MKSCIKVIGTSSSGNCLAIYDSRGKYIVLDCGIKYSSIIKGLDYDLQNCVAVFVTHIHNDHALSINEFINRGVRVFANDEVADTYKRCERIKTALAFDEDGFRVRTFNVEHNAKNNAFIVNTIDGIRVLYVTDAKQIPYTVKDVNYAVIECNYSDDDIIDNMVDGQDPKSQYYNHLSFEKCQDYLKRIYNKDLNGIILWHPSSTNIDIEKAKRNIRETLGFDDVYVGRKNLEIEIKKTAF